MNSTIDDRRYLSRISVWPAIPAEMHPELWIENFDRTDHPLANELLNSFTYFNRRFTDRLLRSAFHGLSAELLQLGSSSYLDHRAAWHTFLSDVIVTYPTGEVPNVTDSGHLFARRVRQLIQIPEEQILSPEQALGLCAVEPLRPIIFVDDFAGSGDQFLATLDREYLLRPGVHSNFASLLRTRELPAYYVPTVATQFAIDRILGTYPLVRVRPAHALDPRYSAEHPDTFAIPEKMRPQLPDFIAKYSARAEIPSGLNYGYYRLGLSIAFEHCIPDATLPVYWFDKNPEWRPLIRRR